VTIAACADLVRRGDPDRFRAVMAAPVAARARLFPLYAWNLEVARAPWASAEPLIGEMRLQWWADVLHEEIPRAHEVAAPLHAVILETGLPVAVMQALIEARRRDCLGAAFADALALDAYLDATAGGLMWLAARALGAPETAEAAARAYGRAAGAANYLRAVPALVARGRVPFPAGFDAADLAYAGLMQLDAARAERRAVPRAAAAALLAGWLTGPVLRCARRDPAAVAEGRLEPSPFRRDAGLLWQAATGHW
jgi:15-cis-phytoene synthase